MFEFVVTIFLDVLGGLVEVSLSSIIEAFYTRQQREKIFAERRAKMTIPAQDREQIIHLCRMGRKIEAIKLYREMTGVGLREAKAAVEDMAQGHEEVSGQNEPVTDELQQLLRAGKKIQAIKYYRQMTGVGLREAKVAVDRMVIGIKEVSSKFQTSLIDPDELRRLLRERKKIEAIKYYRETTGVGLREAKEAVEWVEGQMSREIQSQ